MAWLFAAYYPHLTRGLAILGASSSASRLEWLQTKVEDLRSPAAGKDAGISGDNNNKSKEEKVEHAARTFIQRFNVETQVFDGKDIPSWHMESMLHGAMMAPLFVWQRSLSELVSASHAGSLALIDVPTLLARGKHDKLFDEGDLRRLHDRIKGSMMRTIESAGHAAAWEKPGEVVKLLLLLVSTITMHEQPSLGLKEQLTEPAAENDSSPVVLLLVCLMFSTLIALGCSVYHLTGDKGKKKGYSAVGGDGRSSSSNNNNNSGRVYSSTRGRGGQRERALRMESSTTVVLSTDGDTQGEGDGRESSLSSSTDKTSSSSWRQQRLNRLKTPPQKQQQQQQEK